MQSLFAKYRPTKWSELIGHQQVKVAINRMKERGTLGGRAFWISGASGIGKTTIANLIASDVCDEDNFISLDAGQATPARLEELEKHCRYRCLGEKSGRAVMLNEVHGLRKDSVRFLLEVFERIPNHVTWVLTTTTEGQLSLFEGIDAHPLLSRCTQFTLRVSNLIQPFAVRAKEIAEAEGLGGADLSEYVALAKRCQGNLRMMLSQIEAGEMIRDLAGV